MQRSRSLMMCPCSAPPPSMSPALIGQRQHFQCRQPSKTKVWELYHFFTRQNCANIGFGFRIWLKVLTELIFFSPNNILAKCKCLVHFFLSCSLHFQKHNVVGLLWIGCFQALRRNSCSKLFLFFFCQFCSRTISTTEKKHKFTSLMKHRTLQKYFLVTHLAGDTQEMVSMCIILEETKETVAFTRMDKSCPKTTGHW